jgi:hypothetical protein
VTPRWDQEILPVSRVHNGIQARFGRARGEADGLAVGIVTIHRKANTIERLSRRRKEQEMQPRGFLAAVMISGRVGSVVERIVQRGEITAIGYGCVSRVSMAVVASRRCLQTVRRLHAPIMAVRSVFPDILKDVGFAFGRGIRGH